MLAVSRTDAQESTPLISESHANTRTSDETLVFRHEFGTQDYARRFAPARYLLSVFEPEHDGPSPYGEAYGKIDDTEFASMVGRVQDAISSGVNPRMIAVGTSGSYFVYEQGDHDHIIAGVFKPMDEEPYGNLNLIPNFSYLSEAGASFLDDRLALGMVPKTRLVGLASPSFCYKYADRKQWEKGLKPLPVKVGSLQQFLSGYETASKFFQTHTLPGRPKDLMERVLHEDEEAHRLSRRKPGARLRLAFIAVKRFLLCRYGPGPYGSAEEDRFEAMEPPVRHSRSHEAYPSATMQMPDTFEWTAETTRDLRLELEKLVILDVLMRNTDRGLDNFMIHYNPHPKPGERSITIGAIDNSLAFPHEHPKGLRDYPYGWLFLPADLMGGPFSQETRDLFLPKLTDPIWWTGTMEGLRRIFRQDMHFREKVFRDQMNLIRGQGWNIVQCLQSGTEGPIELCSRPKYMVQSRVQMMMYKDLQMQCVTDFAQGSTTHPAFYSRETESETTVGSAALPRNIYSRRRFHSVDDVRMAKSMPVMDTLLPSSFGMYDAMRSIDVVEKLTIQQHGSQQVRSPLQKAEAPPKMPRRMQSLDLATSAADANQRPIPVLVDELIPVTRHALLTWY
ncbi:lsb6-phosphatidylinositol 4-kinase [Malassezia pachydermatis]|uniref:Phosphatidylinositol 4-kinase n=1 Tax=Malassezia pachydermatis TaxID=77020 RepID=A0A0M8MS54_9BASI|nr:lsb6-phosphatidylinositol 4-kinase [Malassezia pachydermatis]KOS15677.1 lsb6-phosphatidylinositol 4-kinase [Malassezia pachydermatis]